MLRMGACLSGIDFGTQKSLTLVAGVLPQVKVGRRNRAFEAPDVITAFTDLERQLARPEGGTRVLPPARAVPQRRAIVVT